MSPRWPATGWRKCFASCSHKSKWHIWFCNSGFTSTYIHGGHWMTQTASKLTWESLVIVTWRKASFLLHQHWSRNALCCHRDGVRWHTPYSQRKRQDSRESSSMEPAEQCQGTRPIMNEVTTWLAELSVHFDQGKILCQVTFYEWSLIFFFEICFGLEEPPLNPVHTVSSFPPSLLMSKHPTQ